MEQMTEGFGCNEEKGCGSEAGADGEGGEGNWGCGVVQSVGSYLALGGGSNFLQGRHPEAKRICNALVLYKSVFVLGFLDGFTCWYRASWEGGDVQWAIAGLGGSRGIRS